MNINKPKISHLGDSSIVVRFSDKINSEDNDKVYSFYKLIKEKNYSFVNDVIPTYNSVAIEYLQSEKTFFEIKELVKSLTDELSEIKFDYEKKIIDIPVKYGGKYGPDINFVADYCKISREKLIELHTGVDYRVYMIGFSPGFPYLGGMNYKLVCPRVKKPRINVPAGSVGIAEQQTGIYPIDSPGGWQIIGKTFLNLFDLSNKNPSYISPGNIIRFRED
ncbi:MAG: allophanate hydrolase [Dehalococcoidia bacterium]|nr:allophanate hydrolase [Dehalococcoidia bacterium]|tara:strand:+ start:1395 stop:2054 length:660 start_codon:yes stop_codon:yes gene_type:complete